MENRWKIVIPKHNGIVRMEKYETFVEIENSKGAIISTCGQVAIKKRNGKYKMLTGEYGDRNVKIGYMGERRYRDVRVASLVANAFLVPAAGRNYIYYKDRDIYNNHYRNLIYVTKKDFLDLLRREITIKELPYKQYYYPIWAFNPYIQQQKYGDMIRRCEQRNYGMVCETWKNNPNSFYRWMEDASYPDIGYTYEIDKDILVPGNKLYSPETCCLVPKKINLLFELRTNYLHEDKDKHLYWFIRPGTTNNRMYYETKEDLQKEYIRCKAGFIRKQSVRNRYIVTDKIYHAMIDYANALNKLLGEVHDGECKYCCD